MTPCFFYFMNTIYKYQFETTDKFTLNIPAFSEILCVQVQNDVPCIWALVSTTSPTRKRNFEVIGTGHHVDDSCDRKYIGTYQLHGGALVFHLFEI